MNTPKCLLTVAFAGAALFSAQLSADDHFTNDYSAYSAPIHTTPGFDLIEDDDPGAYLDELDPQVAEAKFRIQYNALLAKYEAEYQAKYIFNAANPIAPSCTKASDTMWEAFNDFISAVPVIGDLTKIFIAVSKTVNNISCKKPGSLTPIPTLEEIYNIATNAAGAVVDEALIKDINSEFIKNSQYFSILLENFQNIERDIEVNGMTAYLRAQLNTNLTELRTVYRQFGLLEAKIENRSFNASEVAMLIGGIKIGMLKLMLSIQDKHQVVDYNSITEQQYLNDIQDSQRIVQALIEDFHEYLNTIRSNHIKDKFTFCFAHCADYTTRWIDRYSKTIYKRYDKCVRTIFVDLPNPCLTDQYWDSMVERANDWLRDHKKELKGNFYNQDLKLYLTFLSNPTEDGQNPSGIAIRSQLPGKCINVDVYGQVIVSSCSLLDANNRWSFDTQNVGLIRHLNTNRCLTLTGSSLSNPVVLTTCNESDTRQLWFSASLFDSITPHINLIMCLAADVSNGTDVSSMALISNICSRGDNQRWTFSSAE